VRVLVVDPDADNRNSWSVLLEHWGHEVAVASSASSAILQSPTFQPHAVLSELALPGIDGWELGRWLRCHVPRANHRLLLVAITRYSRCDDRARSQEAGFDFFLRKPADPQVVQDLLSRVEGLEISRPVIHSAALLAAEARVDAERVSGLPG
jgi:CheY-like chemotaxis protein